MSSDKRKAISFSLYGKGVLYSVGAVENLRLAPFIYPGWDVVVHIERGHYATDRLRREGAVIVEHDPAPGYTGAMWRFQTADDTTYSHVIFRDADSRLNPREKAAVDAWLAGGKDLHTMRDHVQHRRPILAGMFGLKVGAVDMGGFLRGWRSSEKYGDDESMLAATVWPLLHGSRTGHASHHKGTGDVDFPGHESYSGFVGERVDPTLPGTDTRVVLLSVESYGERRARFMENYAEHGGVLGEVHDLEWWRATPSYLCYAPPSFRQVRKRPHWWAATCDHLRIMEETLALGNGDLLLFEDDAVLDKDFGERFLQAWCALPEDWRALRLGWHDSVETPSVVDGILRRCDNVSGLMIANLWSNAGLVRAYDHFWHRRKMIIDMAFADLRRIDPVGWYQPSSRIVHIDRKARQRGRDGDRGHTSSPPGGSSPAHRCPCEGP